MRNYKVVITDDAKKGYFLLFCIEKSVVYVTNMFHDLEDYENKLK